MDIRLIWERLYWALVKRFFEKKAENVWRLESERIH